MRILAAILSLIIVQHSTLIGQNSTSLLLNGCDNCLQIEESEDHLQEINELTIEGWVNPNCSEGNNMIITKQWCNGEFSFSVSVNEGKLFWAASPLGFCTSPNFYSSNNSVFPVGVFTHFAIVYSLENGVTMFINGSQVQATWIQGGHTSIAPSSEPVRIGCYKNLSGTSSNYFSGLLNNIRVWERALNPNQVNVNMTNTLTGNEPDLLINLPMNSNNSFGQDFSTPNIVSGFENLVATPWFSSNFLPAITENTSYANASIDFPADVSECNLDSIRLNIPFSGSKSISWHDGSNNSQYIVTGTGQYHVTVETELCRILRDTFSATYLEASESSFSFSICPGDSVIVNGVSYVEGGTFSQHLTNQAGCDSTINIIINEFLPTETNLTYSLCDGESIIVNDVEYNDSGSYQQILTNVNGCDSILNILIHIGLASSTNLLYSLCVDQDIVVNNTVYTTAGEFQQVLTNSTGCDSTINITILPCTQNVSYDFQQCNALTPEQSMTYAEFLPSYRSPVACGDIEMSNVYRIQPQTNKHSCTGGQASTLAMCVGASASCNFEQADKAPVTFGFKAEPLDGSFILFNHLEFYHLSPLNYSWIQGATGPNNYPSRYAIQVFKNDVLIYNQTQLATGQQWKKERFDFFENESFRLSQGDSIRVEITPYCVTPNGGTESVWDIDNIGLYFSCKDVENRRVSGQLTMSAGSSIQTTIQRRNGNKILRIQATDGAYEFPKNNPLTQYEFSGYSDENPSLGLSTFDLVLIQRHILNTHPFENPLQYIAADINNDGKVNAIDLVELRKIILGVKEDFTNNHSYRLIPSKNLNNTDNPLLWNNSILVQPGYNDVSDLDFIIVKIGDLDTLR